VVGRRELIDPQAVKKFPVFYKAQHSCCVQKSWAFVPLLNQLNPVHTHPLPLKFIVTLSSYDFHIMHLFYAFSYKKFPTEKLLSFIILSTFYCH
jgi:hypothetical protein